MFIIMPLPRDPYYLERRMSFTDADEAFYNQTRGGLS